MNTIIDKNDFLFEVGVEEMPATNMYNLALHFADSIQKGLDSADLGYAKIKPYISPRRLAVLVKDLVDKQNDRYIEKRGPGLDCAFSEDGKPQAAALGFARSCGVEVKDLESLVLEEGSWLVYRAKQAGKTSVELLPNIIKAALKELPIGRVMHWGDRANSFIRPVHWILMVYGEQIVPCEIFGFESSNITYGHRFHHPQPIVISEPRQYARILEEQGFVMVDFERRKQAIREQLSKVAHKNGAVVVDEALLEEVTGIVEWPVALLCSFDPRFLELPREVLISVMHKHQRCFNVVDHQGKLLEKFIAVANIESLDPHVVVAGNEKVMRARLSDAEFFYAEDSKNRLDVFAGKLNTVIFQDQLGTLYDKSMRMDALMDWLAPEMRIEAIGAKRAAFLSKADLVTSMVGELPELQGIMGYYYALNQGEDLDIALAIKDHYLPRFSGDSLPTTSLGIALAIADRIDTLVGIFALNKAPTGDKDPFGLRRAALGVMRIILQNNLWLDIEELFTSSVNTYKDAGIALPNKNVVTDLLEFFWERLRGLLVDDVITTNIFNAVLACKPTQILDFELRVQAVNSFLDLDGAQDLIAAHKRINNILKKSTIDEKCTFNRDLLQDDAEIELYNGVQDLKRVTETLCEERFYAQALNLLADIKPVVDDFFDQVMVMVDDENLRNNRLLLLSELRDILALIADISLL